MKKEHFSKISKARTKFTVNLQQELSAHEELRNFLNLTRGNYGKPKQKDSQHECSPLETQSKARMSAHHSRVTLGVLGRVIEQEKEKTVKSHGDKSVDIQTT